MLAISSPARLSCPVRSCPVLQAPRSASAPRTTRRGPTTSKRGRAVLPAIKEWLRAWQLPGRQAGSVPSHPLRICFCFRAFGVAVRWGACAWQLLYQLVRTKGVCRLQRLEAPASMAWGGVVTSQVLACMVAHWPPFPLSPTSAPPTSLCIPSLSASVRPMLAAHASGITWVPPALRHAPPGVCACGCLSSPALLSGLCTLRVGVDPLFLGPSFDNDSECENTALA